MKLKNNWGGIRKENEMIKKYHEQWAKENGYRDNDKLNANNSDRFVNYEKGGKNGQRNTN